MAKTTTNLHVKLCMAQAQLYAAQMAMGQARRDHLNGLITRVELGRILAKQTRLENKVFWARAEVEGRVIYSDA